MLLKSGKSGFEIIGSHIYLSLQICNPPPHVGLNSSIQGVNFCKEGIPLNFELSSLRVQQAFEGGQLCLQGREVAFSDVAVVAQDVRLHPLQAAVDRSKVFFDSRLKGRNYRRHDCGFYCWGYLVGRVHGRSHVCGLDNGLAGGGTCNP